MNTSSLSLLIADDNEVNRWVLAEQLQFWSQDIVQAHDGLDAWNCLQQRRFDMVFLDLGMPNLDGLSLMKRLRRTSVYAKSPIIAVTAHLLSNQRADVIEQGFDEVLLKPIVLADLQPVIARFGVLQFGFDIDHYVDAMLMKVSQNRVLADALLKKLLIDMPALFETLSQALRQQDFKVAWTYAHQVHGAFCFYGFDDFKAMAQALEQAVLECDAQQTIENFQLLQRHFRKLMRSRGAIFERLTTQDAEAMVKK